MKRSRGRRHFVFSSRRFWPAIPPLATVECRYRNHRSISSDDGDERLLRSLTAEESGVAKSGRPANNSVAPMCLGIMVSARNRCDRATEMGSTGGLRGLCDRPIALTDLRGTSGPVFLFRERHSPSSARSQTL